MINVSREWHVKTRFYVTGFSALASGSTPDISWQAPTSPASFGRLVFGYGSTTGQTNWNGVLSVSQISNAISMFHFGELVPQLSTYNRNNTEITITGVTYYGPLDGADAIGLQVDLDPADPGFVGNDSGNRKSRPVVSMRAARYRWWDLTNVGTDNTAVIGIYLYGPSRQTDLPLIDFGVVDVSAIVRRAWDTSGATTLAKDTNEDEIQAAVAKQIADKAKHHRRP